MFTQNRQTLRQYYIDVWQKYQAGDPLEPLQNMICDVILLHPEYHRFLQTDCVEKDYLPEMGETNPFLHLSLHLALQEQLSTNRPAGIRDLYQNAIQRIDRHDLEHRMIDCLAEALWTAQRHNTLPDEQAYLACLQKVMLIR